MRTGSDEQRRRGKGDIEETDVNIYSIQTMSCTKLYDGSCACASVHPCASDRCAITSRSELHWLITVITLTPNVCKHFIDQAHDTAVEGATKLIVLMSLLTLDYLEIKSLRPTGRNRRSKHIVRLFFSRKNYKKYEEEKNMALTKLISGHRTRLVYIMSVCVSHQVSDKRNGFPLAKVRHTVNAVECTSHSE